MKNNQARYRPTGIKKLRTIIAVKLRYIETCLVATNERSRFVSNHTHFSTTDSEARISVKSGKPRQLNYLAQVSVDTPHHVITQIQSDNANKKDSQSLPLLLTNTIQNLQENHLQVEEVLADGGYSGGEELQALEDNNFTPCKDDFEIHFLHSL